MPMGLIPEPNSNFEKIRESQNRTQSDINKKLEKK